MGLRGLRAVLGFAAAVVLVPALGGCGESKGEAVTETVPRMTKARLAERLGDICQEHTDRQVIAIERFDRKHGLPSGTAHEKASPAQLEEELTAVILPIVRDNIHDLEAELRPAPDQEAKLAAFIRALEHGIAFSEENPGWVTGKIATEPFSRARYLSVELGTPLCGQA
jgi:hypothetical protein